MPSVSIQKKSTVIPVTAIIISVFLWGSSFALMRIAVATLSPWTVMWCRMVIASILVLPFIKQLLPRNYEKGDWKLLLLLVICQPCFYFLFESYALRYTTSTQAGIVSASLPLMVAVGAWVVLAEPINARIILGLVISIFGVVCLTLFGDQDAAANPLLGNAFEFLAMVFGAGYMVLIKKLSDRYNTWTLTSLQMFTGSFFFSPGLVILSQVSTDVWSYQLIGILIFLGSLVTLGAFGLYNWGIGQINASKASAFINLIPVVAVIIGWVWLGESLTIAQCFFAGLVILGVWISQRK